MLNGAIGFALGFLTCCAIGAAIRWLDPEYAAKIDTVVPPNDPVPPKPLTYEQAMEAKYPKLPDQDSRQQ